MKISIREALFSGEEVDDWEPPKFDSNEFIFDLYDRTDKDKWSQEALKPMLESKTIKLSPANSYLEKTSGWSNHWGNIDRTFIRIHGTSISSLNPETSPAIWHIDTETILFCYDKQSRNLIEQRDPKLLAFIHNWLKTRKPSEDSVEIKL